MSSPTGARRRGGALRYLAFAVVLMAALIFLYVRINGTRSDGDGAGPPPAGLACVRDAAEDADYCDRFVADLGHRAPLTNQQTQVARAAKETVAQALSGDILNRCNVRREPCDPLRAWGDRPITPEDLRSRLLTVASNPQVRAARPDDPAVAGSVVFGVLIDQVCVYGHQRLNKDPDRVYAAGPLPDGNCLMP